MRRLWGILILFLTLTLSVQGAEQDLLKIVDVNRIMKQILDQHVEKKEISTKILQSAIIIYIDQFDPFRIYLLDQEVEPFFHIPENQLERIFSEYNLNQFEIFHEIDHLIQNSIERSRRMRQEIEQKDPKELRLYSLSAAALQKGLPFAHSIDELKERLFQHFIAFIETQKRQYGEAVVNQNIVRVTKVYEENLRDFENQYLYQDDKGNSLSPAEQENLFAIHVLKALASSLDSHTTFYRANEAYDMRVRLQKEFQGVGIALKEKPEGIVVVNILEGSPAAKSGLIEIGDILVEVNGKPSESFTFEKLIEFLHADKEREVKLVFKHPAHEGQPEKIFQVTLKRELIVLNQDRVDVSSEPFGDGIIGKITLHSFYQGDGVSSEKDVREAIQKLEKKGHLKGLILDLRDNTGGFLSQAVKVAGLFITNGIIVISKYSTGEEKFYRDVDSRVAFDGPLVILTSKNTASAAEIVAQALQDYGVAIVVGDEHTYGKGTIQTQTVTDKQSHSFFKVTVGKYYTVSGRTPQKEGVKADVLVPSRLGQELIGEEFMESVEGDQISPFYEDLLQGVSPDVKGWYLKYYTPTIQHQKTVWRQMIPALQKNSTYRIEHNKNYQFYLKGDTKAEEDLADEEDLIIGEKKKKNFGVNDLQMQEAVNIVKDMITLHALQSGS